MEAEWSIEEWWVLQSECDKLRSVLELKAESAAVPVKSKASRTSDDAVKELGGGGSEDGAPKEETKRRGKMAISAEPAAALAADTVLTHHQKTPGAKQLIKDAVQANDFLRQLDHEQVSPSSLHSASAPRLSRHLPVPPLSVIFVLLASKMAIASSLPGLAIVKISPCEAVNEEWCGDAGDRDGGVYVREGGGWWSVGDPRGRPGKQSVRGGGGRVGSES